MRSADVPAMVALAALVHPGLPEDAEVFAERLALHPDGCFALDGPNGLAGYLLSHPWRLGAPPKLNRRLGALPAAADTYYLHDLALHPAVQRTGAARPILRAILARDEFPTQSLVAVNGSAPFWHGHGFSAAPGPDLAEYGPDAVHMVRQATGR
jgi:hypothetical protein